MSAISTSSPNFIFLTYYVQVLVLQFQGSKDRVVTFNARHVTRGGLGDGLGGRGEAGLSHNSANFQTVVFKQ